jgi:hypothetical protein
LLDVSSKFMATCVIEKDTERLDGFAFTTSQKLFNFSFPQLNKYEFLFYCFFFVVLLLLLLQKVDGYSSKNSFCFSVFHHRS